MKSFKAIQTLKNLSASSRLDSPRFEYESFEEIETQFKKECEKERLHYLRNKLAFQRRKSTYRRTISARNTSNTTTKIDQLVPLI